MTEKRQVSEQGGNITMLLRQWGNGDASALDQLTPLIYSELRRIAHHWLRGESKHLALETTGLVQEAFVRLLKTDVDWNSRQHFFALSSRLIRRVLVDLARERKSHKRGHGVPHITLGGIDQIVDEKEPSILALDEALESLARFDERKARIIELRFFAGMTIDETAEVLEISHATVERDFRAAKAWLAAEIRQLNP